MKLQYFGHLTQTANSLEKTLMLGKIEDKRRGQQKMRWLGGITDSADMSLSKFQEIVKDREAWQAEVRGIAELDMILQLKNKKEAGLMGLKCKEPLATMEIIGPKDL